MQKVPEHEPCNLMSNTIFIEQHTVKFVYLPCNINSVVSLLESFLNCYQKPLLSNLKYLE